MTEVKSMNVTADTYRHRGWMWRDRGTYETFKAHMKLPLWIDRILTDSGGDNLFVVGKEDGDCNTSYVGSFSRGLEKGRILDAQPARSTYHCNTRVGNGFVVVAERIRAKKPDANKTPRPQWRQPMTKPWEPAALCGEWVIDSKFVKEVKLKTTPPAWADRLWVSTSGNADTFVWVDSRSAIKWQGMLDYRAAGANGVIGYQPGASPFAYKEVAASTDCHWQLAGVRKKTVQVPEVVKPEPDVSMTATPVRAAQVEQASFGTGLGGIIGPTPRRVTPRRIHDERRANELAEAMVRYLNEDLAFPIEWATEWNELRARLNKEHK